MTIHWNRSGVLVPIASRSGSAGYRPGRAQPKQVDAGNGVSTGSLISRVSFLETINAVADLDESRGADLTFSHTGPS
jgi:hypothetical protein